MSKSGSTVEIKVQHRVHPGLQIDAAFEIEAERLILFGPSGSGKSTLLRLISGLSRPDQGRIALGDQVLFDRQTARNLPSRKRGIGLIFQDDRLFPHLSVEGNVRFGLKGWEPSKASARVREVAELCEIESLLDRSPSTLSGGERQRVGLARSIAPRPRLLLCDEPVSALDLAGRFPLLDRLRTVQEAERLPMLYVTHSPTEALAIGTRLLLWDEGRVIEEGRPLDILARTTPGSAFENLWQGVLTDRGDEQTEIQLDDGPIVVAPACSLPVGSRLTVRVRADEIVLARDPITRISARNLIPATIDRIMTKDREAHVVCRTRGVEWVAGLTTGAVESLGLAVGSEVFLIVKARSVHLTLTSTGGSLGKDQ